MDRPRRIVALGGHEFRGRGPELAILQHVLGLSGSDSPRVCLLPTAGGDSRDGIADFYSAADRFDCIPSHLSLFRLEHERVDLRRHLLAQDLIYVAGGSLVNLLAVWRAHRLPALFAEAWRSGVVLAGQSAGALCWFDHGISASSGAPAPIRGLGLVRGSLCVHYARDPARRIAYLEAVAGGLPGGWGIDDGAGIIFESGAEPVPLSGRERARVIRVERVSGRAIEIAESPRGLSYRPPGPRDPALAEAALLRRPPSPVAARGPFARLR
ncbi:MAG TPA: peptidase E [Solirubrobacterales bacterium]